MLGGPVDIVQRKLGVPVTDEWDAVTLGALTAYQSSGAGPWPMYPHGHPDPATLYNLGYYDPIEELTAEQRAYVEGRRDKPSTFFRDLGGASAQVPRWAWIAVGVGLIAVGIYTYRAAKKG
jgi:hypothetical protein